MPDTATAAVTIDCYGLTHQGRVRESNEDHFVIAVVSKSVDVRHTSLSNEVVGERFGTAEGYLFAVADGVGGRPEGDVASERTVGAVLGYLTRAAACFQGLDADREHELLAKLEETVRTVHAGLLADYGGGGDSVPATTLTMVLLAWPRAYLVHVGDSRAYIRRHGRLERLTRDQTLGEYMVAAGAWTEEQAERSRAGEALSSAVGGSDLTPVVGLVDLDPGDSILVCTDGLTKHVTDERIAAALEQTVPASEICRQLVDQALAGGGSDNVTVVLMKTSPA